MSSIHAWILTASMAISSSLNASAPMVTEEDKADRFVIPPIEQSHITLGNASRQALNPRSIKVMVWNIYKTKKDKWKRDFIKYGSDRDIFLLQEGVINGVMDKTFEQFPGHRFDMGVSFIIRKKKIPSGTVIGSNVSPNFVTIDRTEDVEPIYKTPKILTIGKYPIASRGNADPKELLVVNIHGLNFTKLGPFKKHIDTCAKYIESHKGPVIFAGDFNTRNHERLNYMVKTIHKLGLRSVSFRNDERMEAKFTELFLDHTFTKGLRVKDAEVLSKSKGSDHKAMYFEVSVE